MSIKHSQHKAYPDTVLVRTFKGEVSTDDIIASWKHLIEHNLITKNIKGVLNDLEDCDLCMNMDGFRILMDYMKEQKPLEGIKIAVVTNSPKRIIFPALGETNEKPLNIKPFSTFAAAVEWISGEIYFETTS